VKLATAGRSGKVTKLISVETDDPVTPKITLTVTANIVVDVDFERPSLGFPSLKIGEQTSSAMPILAKDPAGLELGEVTNDIPGLAARLVKGEKEGKPSWSLDVSFKPEKVGNVSGTVKLQVKKPKETELILRITGRVEGNIKATPPVISLRKPLDPKQPGIPVALKAEKGIFRIKKVREETGKVAVKTETVTEGKEYKLIITVSEAGLKDERFSTKLVVTTSSKQQPEIEIPVYYSSAPAPFKPGIIKPPPPNLKPGGSGIHPAFPIPAKKAPAKLQ
jgi:hypothetical protein